MSKYTLSLEECCKNLRSYDAEVEGLMNLVGDKSQLTPERVELARNQLKSLKVCLEQDCKRQSSEMVLTQPEYAVYMPAIRQARADLTISAASRPSTEWFDKLYGVQITLRHAIAQLEHWEQ